MNIRLTVLAILLFTNYAFADKLTVYRWLDKNNIVHFSQHQPDHNNYVEISMSNNINQRITVEPQLSTVDNRTELNANNEVLQEPAISKCDTAKENLKILREFERIQYKDATGKVQVLGEIEKQQQLEMNKKQAEVYCQ